MSVDQATRHFLRKLLKADRSVVDYPPQGKVYTLDELQKAVEGYIEVLHLKGGYLMVVNEEGKLKGLPVNELATVLYERDEVVGNALVCRDADIDQGGEGRNGEAKRPGHG